MTPPAACQESRSAQSRLSGRLLRISATGVRLVACTTALHQLLPNLVVPVDRQFTGAFSGWNTYDWKVTDAPP